jgi:hypothetical protein
VTERVFVCRWRQSDSYPLLWLALDVSAVCGRCNGMRLELAQVSRAYDRILRGAADRPASNTVNRSNKS